MPGLDKNRKRNQTICFRASIEERRTIEARIIASGIPKGEYYRKSLIDQKIVISVGKYESDRLALAMKRLYKQIELSNQVSDEEKLKELIEDSNVLFTELNRILLEQKENTSD